MDKEPETAAILIDDFMNHVPEVWKKYKHIFSCYDCSLDFSSRKKAESGDSAKPGEYWYSIRSGYGAKCPHCGKWLRDLKNREITQEAVFDMVMRNISPLFMRSDDSSADYWRGKYDAYKEMKDKE